MSSAGPKAAPLGQRRRLIGLSSPALFLAAVLLLNLASFQPELESWLASTAAAAAPAEGPQQQRQADQSGWRLLFTQPGHLRRRAARVSQAQARMLGKMAKVWYIKKKIKKLSKKLKKNTIAVPVFTAIPIYEHSYYPQPHVSHVTHHGMHHAAASSYSPAVAQLAAAGSNPAAAHAQPLSVAASNSHQQVASFRPLPHAHAHHHGYGAHPQGPMHAMASHQIINAYAPSPPLFVDEAGGLYGHYGNAYGRYDGGYQLW